MRSIRAAAFAAALAFTSTPTASAVTVPSRWQPKLLADAGGVAAFPDALFAAASSSGSLAGGMLYRSSDGGATWTNLRAPGSPTGFAMASPEVGYFMTVPGGTPVVYRTLDGGRSWTPLDVPFPTYGHVGTWRLAAAKGGSTVVATSDDPGYDENLCDRPAIAHVFVSTDSGTTFRATRIPAENVVVDNVAVTPRGEIALSVSALSAPGCSGEAAAGIWTTDNAGRNYTHVLPCRDCRYVARPAANHLVTATLAGLVRVSTDTGRTWSPPVTGAISPLNLRGGPRVQGIVFGSASVGYLSADDGGVHRTSDGGYTWTHEPSLHDIGGPSAAWGAIDADGAGRAILGGAQVVLVRS